jgi:hypothetical protein
MIMGGGSSQPSSQQVTQTNLPEYARPYFERMMSRTEGISNEPYTPYGGRRVEDLNAMQKAGIDRIGAMGPAWQTGQASNMLSNAANSAARDGQFQHRDIGSSYAPNATTMFGAPDRVQSTFQGGEFDSAAADKYMSPYQQKVIDIAKREAIRNHGIAGVGRDMESAKRGSFGGSRHAIMQAEAERNLGQQLDDIQVKGSDQAFQNAQQQFERDRQARAEASRLGLGAAQFNSQQQMAYGQSGMQNQQFNEGQRERAAAMQLQGQIANEQARAGAAGVRQNAWQNSGNLANTMAGIGKTEQDMALQRHTAMLGAGDKMQQTNQAALDAAYDDFVNQRDYEKQQLAFYNSILRGYAGPVNSDVQTRQASNPLSQIAGLGVAGLGAYKAYQGS